MMYPIRSYKLPAIWKVNLSDVDTIENKTLHFLAKRKNPKFNFLSNLQWIKEGDADEEGNKTYHCLVCNEIMFLRQRNGWYEPSPTPKVAEHTVRHLKDFKLVAFL